MSFATCTTIVGVFNGRPESDRVIDNLGKAGFHEKQINIECRKLQGAAIKNNGEAEFNAATGAVAGAAIGALLGLGFLAAIIFVMGATIPAGTLVAIVGSAAGGASIAGFAVALIGRRIPAQSAKSFGSQIQSDRILVTVHADDRWETAHSIIESHGGYGPPSGANDATTAKTRTATAPPPKMAEPIDRANTTGVNVRDRGTATMTPLDQNKNKADIRTNRTNKIFVHERATDITSAGEFAVAGSTTHQ